jgi:hypothetical protein
MAMSWSKTKAPLLGALSLSAALAGCSDIYFDRREHIVPYAGDAMATNRVTQMVDPWPPASANRNIAFNGEVMQHAVERYREGRVIPPVNATTSSTAYAKAQATAATAAQTTRTSTSSSAAAPPGWASRSAPQNPSQNQNPAPQPQYPDSDPGETR